MNNIKNMIKKNKGLYSLALKTINSIPKNLLYPRVYFKINQLLNLNDLNKLNLEGFRNKRLCMLLKEAIEYVPYYHKLNLGIDIQDITEENSFEMLKLFPYLDKKVVMENPDEFINIKYKKSNLIYGTSGGSTGQGIGVWMSKKEGLIERSFYDYKWSKLGYKNYSKIVRMGCDGIKNQDENPCEVIGNRLLVSPYHFNNKKISSIYKNIVDFRGEYFHVYPSCFEYLLRYMKEEKLGLKGYKAILLVSERITNNLLELCKEILPNVTVNFSYGLSERTNLAWGIYENGTISYKCDEVYGYSENYITENGFYEIIGTSYWNYVMPLIRYKTQDLGKIENGIIITLDGRNQEFLITKNGEKISGFTISIDKFVWEYIDIFQVIQNEPGKVEFHIKPKNNFSDEIKNRILINQNIKWGKIFDISIILEKEIAKTKSGKLRLVINNIK